jgi:hypothetical protein
MSEARFIEATASSSSLANIRFFFFGSKIINKAKGEGAQKFGYDTQHGE